MHYKTMDYLINKLNISKKAIDICVSTEEEVSGQFQKIDEISEYNQYKVLSAMQKNRISEMHFNYSTGYGYGDVGREALDKVYADVFGCEDALVRPQIVSGTHALSLCLYGVLRPGDELLSVTGRPYDTLEGIIGIDNCPPGCLRELNVRYSEIDFNEAGKINYNEITKRINKNTKMVLLQRSLGYSWRSPLTLEDIEYTIKLVKIINPNIVCMVDNCYGEFLDLKEPTEIGADIMAGSLIKNPGGSIAPTGGYVCGKAHLVEMAANRLIAPGIGKECGATLGMNRLFFQGLFIAPHIVSEALKGAVFCSRLFSKLGFEVNPEYNSRRSDIIQAIKFGDSEALIAFCQGIQKGSPVDSFVSPEPWEMPGYNDPVIMAAGGFVQGASIELSADAPLRPPYIAYLQGGVTFEHVKIGIIYALQNLANRGYVTI
ncbi:MAG TPA: methionine gamma-lyase family protein [Bacillota bacterium]|nr:methionine gamma-lyase family protein [Bacillota bacterium]